MARSVLEGELLVTGFPNRSFCRGVCSNHQNVTLVLAYNIVPNAGLLPLVSARGEHSFRFPATYAHRYL